MKKLLSFLFIITALVSCKKEISSLSDLQSNFYALQNTPIHLKEVLEVTFDKNTDKIDSVALFLNEISLKNKSILDSTNATLGLNKLEMKVYVNGDSIWGKTQIPVLSSFEETPVKFEIVNKYPHPAELFTEGLFFYNNKVYESAGQFGKSKLVNFSLGSTDYTQEVTQDKDVFSEGATVFNNKIYQLTYRQRKVFVYDITSLKLLETLKMPDMVKEGWGMTTNGLSLIISDGTQNLYFFDENLALQKKLQIAGYLSIYTNLNELEYINDRIYANVWQTNYILVINPESGAVEQYFDLASISETQNTDDVLNGIAYYQNHLLVTGKNWSNLYEISMK